jgi:hypothetical protein
MADDPVLIIQVPVGSSADWQLHSGQLAGVLGDDVLVQRGPTDAEGNLEVITGGEVVLSVPSPEALERDADEVGRVIRLAGTGVAPLVVVVQAAEEFRDVELSVVVEAARRAARPVILRVIRQA